MRTKKAFLNMFASIIYQIVAIICGLITPRLILSSFGSTYNGVISSANQFLDLVSITLGITATTRVALYKTLANKDLLGTSRIMKANKCYMRKVAAFIILYAAVLCLVYPFISNNNLPHSETAMLIAIVSVSTFAQYFFGISNTTLLSASQCSYVIIFVNTVKIILNTACVAVLIYANASIFTVKLGSSIVFFLAPLVLEIYVRRKYRLIQDCEPDFDSLKGQNAVVVHQIANSVHDNTDILLLTFFTDVKQISVYTVYYLVVGQIKKLLAIFTNGMEAAFGDMWVKKEFNTLNTVFRTYEFLIFSFTAIVFSCMSTLILPFVEIYTQGVNDVSYVRIDLAVLISIAEAIFCLRQPYLLLVYATGHYKETKNGAMLEAIINLTVSFVLVIFIGIPGVIIGTIAANFFRTTQYIIFASKNILHRNVEDIIKRVIWLMCCFAIAIPLSLFAQNFLSIFSGWGGWLLKAIVTFFISCMTTLLFATFFYRSDLINLIRKFGQVFKKKRIIHGRKSNSVI